MKRVLLLLSVLLGLVLFAGAQDFLNKAAEDQTMSDVKKSADGTLSAFKISGSGIATGKPDGVYVKLAVSSGSMTSLRSAQNDVDGKISFIIGRLTALYRMKKEDFKVFQPAAQMKEQTLGTPTSLVVKDSNGNPIKQTAYKYLISKTVIMNGLVDRKIGEVFEIVDRAVSYGATAIAAIDKGDGSEVASSTIMTDANSSSGSKIQLSKGVSKLKIDKAEDASSSEFINFFFKDQTLDKLKQSARAEAVKEVKGKIAEAGKKYTLDEKKYEIGLTEDYTATQTAEGELSVKCDLAADYKVPVKQ